MSYRLPSLGTCTLVAAMWCALPAHALINGTNTSSFSAVGALGGATGVLVANNWVLTAAHVATSLAVGSSGFESLVGNSLVDAVYTFSSTEFPNNDVALLHLSTALNAALPILNDADIRANQLATLGTLTIATAQNEVPNGVGTTTASSVQPTYTKQDTGTTYTVNWLVTQGGSTVESGDSGGALFKGAVSNSGGALLLGIASSQLTYSDGSKGSAFVQVASYKSWINSVMAPSGQSVVWASSVPEPSTFMLFALSGFAFCFARTRHFG